MPLKTSKTPIQTISQHEQKILNILQKHEITPIYDTNLKKYIIPNLSSIKDQRKTEQIANRLKDYNSKRINPSKYPSVQEYELFQTLIWEQQIIEDQKINIQNHEYRFILSQYQDDPNYVRVDFTYIDSQGNQSNSLTWFDNPRTVLNKLIQRTQKKLTLPQNQKYKWLIIEWEEWRKYSQKQHQIIKHHKNTILKHRKTIESYIQNKDQTKDRGIIKMQIHNNKIDFYDRWTPYLQLKESYTIDELKKLFELNFLHPFVVFTLKRIQQEDILAMSDIKLEQLSNDYYSKTRLRIYKNMIQRNTQIPSQNLILEQTIKYPLGVLKIKLSK